MKITLTPTNATLTAQTVKSEVTIPLRRTGRMSDGIWRQFAAGRPRARFIYDPDTGIATKTF